jgi:phage tail tape-measure protein
MSASTVVFNIKANTAQLVKGLTRAEWQMKKTVSKMKNTVLGLAAAYVSVQTAMKGFDVAKQVGTSMVKTASEFEKFTTVLRTIEGSSSKAQSSMNWITKFAKTTPYELSQVTEAFIKLKSYGIQPTSGTLRVLGDTASAMGKPLNQAVEAMADAIVGENERLKEFGIRAAKQGDQIAYSWTDASGKAKHIIVENNSQIIESTLDAIFSSKYAGAMEDQSKTYEGMLSNMSDNWTVFQKQMMDAGAFDYIKAVIKTVGDSFSSMYSATLKNTDGFTKGLMESFKSIVVGLGKLGNAFEGIAIFAETAWNVIKAGWNALVVAIVGGAASLIDTLKSIFLKSSFCLP